MQIRPVKLSIVAELLGLCLVLLAAGFQLFLASPLSDAAQEGTLVRSEERIKYIWLYLGAESRTKDPAVLRDRYNSLDRSVSDVEAWGSRLKRQSDIAKNVYAWMYFVGSVLLLIGRYLELSNKNEQRRPTMPSSGRAKRRRAA
jgi:hypothetical protein